MATAVMVFTRDLRTRDLPALVAACEADEVAPLFVFDDAVLSGAHGCANRVAYLLDALEDLDDRLSHLGADLVTRRGDWVEEVVRVVVEVGATQVHISADVSGFAQRRNGRLRGSLAGLDGVEVDLVEHPGVTVLPPGATEPTGGGAWKVFTPFHKRWMGADWRAALDPPDMIRIPDGLHPGSLPAMVDLVDGEVSPGLIEGGEGAALERLKSWAGASLAGYADRHDDLAGDATSHISADLHFGCLSPLEVATRLRTRDGGGPFVRQLCWRDFYHQLLSIHPETAHDDYRSRNDHWREDADELDAWRTGRTGFPLVDAAMRQLRREGWMHNRARMVVASFLTKDLYIDWRHGAQHFMAWLVDGDVANNQLNWQWNAGTGTDTNPHRIFNPTTQSKRFDPDGAYIRRYVDELVDVEAPEIHDPEAATRDRVGYPRPVVDHRDAIEAYKAQLERQRG